MSAPTPKSLRDPVLAAIKALCNGQTGVPVSSADVIDRVITELGITDPEMVAKTRANISWVATQTLRPAGIISFGTRRGQWVLEAQGNLSADDADDEGLDAFLQDIGGTNSTPPTDNVGVVLFTTPVQNSYVGDNYIFSIALADTPCYGAYDETEQPCRTCPISASCRGVLIKKLEAQATILFKASSSAASRPATGVTSKTSPRSLPEVLGDISTMLDTPPAHSSSPKLETARRARSGTPSLCQKCQGRIAENEFYAFVVGIGGFHITCSPYPLEETV